MSVDTTNVPGWSRLVSRLGFLGEVLTFLVEVLALCLPALINQGPLLFEDSRAYYIGGRAAMEKINAVFHHGGISDDFAATISKARGVRSAFYSLFEYLLTHIGSLWLVAIVQAAITALVIRLVFHLLCPYQPRWRATLCIVTIAITTTASWTVSDVMPDLFTPILILCVIVALVFWERLHSGIRWALFLGIATSMVMHLTNLPLALGLLITGGLLRQRLWPERSRHLMIVGAIGVGVIASLAVGVLGFRQWTIAPQSPPFLLARSIADGPAKLYLLENCPQIGLVMCRHLDRLDVSVDDFLWHPNGVYSAVSVEEQAQLRADDKYIFIAATLAHPWMEAEAIIRNTLTQLVWFTLRDYHIPSAARYNATEFIFLNEVEAMQPWQSAYSIFDYLVVVIGLGYGLYAWRSGLTRDQRDVFILVLATILLEALVAGAFSVPAPRYEARVIWIIPMTGLLFACNRRSFMGVDRL